MNDNHALRNFVAKYARPDDPASDDDRPRFGPQYHAGVIRYQKDRWRSDYPHAESTFPRSREIVERLLKDVPEDERALIAGGNAARLYHFSYRRR
jgi:predicted TIM-barrel fold metal-dependent hydrolase